MTMFDDEETVNAPINLVWREANNLIDKEDIEREETNSLLFAFPLLHGQVYLMKQNPDGSTQLRVVIEKVERIREYIDSDQDPWIAFDNMYRRYDTLGELIINIIFGAFGATGGQDIGERHLAKIKRKSERAAMNL